MKSITSLAPRRPLLAGALALTLTAALAAPASATGGIRTAWVNRYTSSQSYQNASCALCHKTTSQTDRYNAYGYAIKQLIDQGMSNNSAFTAVEGLDSDQDPTGSTNLFEIQNDTQPGWTDGPNNTTYTGGGSPTTGVSPPTSITGLMDPVVGLGTNYCGPAVTNSTGQPAALSASGSAVVSDNDLTLEASQMPPGQFAYFLNSMTQGFSANPGGSQGNLCLGGGIGRYNANVFNTGGSGSGSLLLDLTNTPTPTGPVSVMAGETWNFQCWYRDLNPGTTSNFTDGLSITFM